MTSRTKKSPQVRRKSPKSASQSPQPRGKSLQPRGQSLQAGSKSPQAGSKSRSLDPKAASRPATSPRFEPVASERAARQGDESAIDRVLGAIDTEAAEMVRSYLSEPLLPTDLLAEQTRFYYERLEELAGDGEVIDLELATELAVRCERLLDEMDDDKPEEHRRLVQAAVLYFVNDEDADSDSESLIGFDDDTNVIEAVALAIDCAHVLESSAD